MAEGVFQHLTKPAGGHQHPLINRIDSAGTGGYHIGSDPDPRTMSTLADNGITEYEHRARKLSLRDFNSFDYILAMDRENLENIDALRKLALEKGLAGKVGTIKLFGDYGGQPGEEVIDPYYGARDGFDIAYEQMVRFTKGFLQSLEDSGTSS